MIDTHAHIYAEQFDKDRDEMLERAFSNGVAKILMPNIDHTSIDGMMELEVKYPQKCMAMMGLHPCHVNKDFEKELYIVENWLQKRDFVAVGEIGVDLYWDKSFKEQQFEAFNIQAGWAKKYQIPIAVHSRDAMTECIELIEKQQDGSLTGVLHCFTGNREEAERLVKAGFYLGIGGVSTFKKGGLDQVIPHIDLKHLVLETDCPYLAPTPKRGKRNEPSYLTYIVEKIADYKAISIDEVIEKTTQNAQALFSKMESMPA